MEEAYKIASLNNIAKANFLSIVSHELRTPLNAIMGSLQISLENHSDDDLLKVALEGSERLTIIINKILTFSEIKAGSRPLKYVLFNIVNITNFINILFKHNNKNNIKTSIKCKKLNSFSYLGDIDLIRLLICQLVENAFKFTDEGYVDVEIGGEVLSNNKELLILEIIDSGAGIPLDKINDLLEPFTQLDSSSTRRWEGLGLGLTLVKSILDILGGVIDIQPREVGTKITVKIPLKTDMDSESRSIEMFKVLAVEGNSASIHLLEMVLSRVGVDFDIAVNGEQGIEMFKSGNYDLVFMDLHLPDCDGFEASAKLRKQNSEVPIVALSACELAQNISKCRDVGMNDFIQKPVTVEKVNYIIRKFLLLGPMEAKLL